MGDDNPNPAALGRQPRPYVRLIWRILLVAWVLVAYAVAFKWLGPAWDLVVGIVVVGVIGLNGYYMTGIWNGYYDEEPMPPGPGEADRR